MKTLFKFIVLIAFLVFALVTFIKIVGKYSWKEAIGIAEELWIEMTESCGCCNTKKSDSET